MPAPRVVITGIGVATPMGACWSDFVSALFAGGARFAPVHTAYANPVAGARVDFDPTLSLSRVEARTSDRHAQLALHAGSQALRQAGLDDRPDLRRHMAVSVGCGSGPTHANQTAYHEQMVEGGLHGLSLLRCLPSNAAALVAMRHGLGGPSQTQGGACAASTLAIGEALRALRHGYIDLALVGGAEAPFGDVTIKAWDRLRVLAPLGDDANRSCRPFDLTRQGLVLGEGAAFFVLETEAHAARRGVPALAAIDGFGASCDAQHWTDPQPDGQVRAMQAALADAGLQPGAVQAVNAHGTATQAGDAAEAESIVRVFGSAADAPWVHASKSLHGHLLGASGAVELAVVVACLQAARVPATRNLRRPGVPGLRLVTGDGQALAPAATMLSNSFAFGGGNACLVVSGLRA